MKRKWILVLLLAVAVVVSTTISGCTSAPPGKRTATVRASPTTQAINSTATVVIKDTAFQPGEVKISRGGTVTWINEDTTRHDVSFNGDTSPILRQGEKYTRTFNNSGTFNYTCTIHPNMKGRVIVT